MKALPVELLSSIFVKVLPPHLDDPRYDVKDPAPTHATICCVCQKWNQVAKSTPSLWTFIQISYRASSHDVMKSRLELSGNLPLNISMQLCQDTHTESLTGIHGLLLGRVSRWNTLRVEATVEEPSALRQWVPSELPNVVGLSLALEVIDQVPEDDTDSREPFISAARLNFCSSKSPVLFSLTRCPLLQEYRAISIGFEGVGEPPRAAMWKSLITTLSKECPQLEVLQVSREGYDVWGEVERQDGSWPALSSLTTLRFDLRPSYEAIHCILTELKAPQLRLVEFRDAPVTAWNGGNMSETIPDILFPAGNDGRTLFSGMGWLLLIHLLMKIPNCNELKVDLDLASIIAEDRSIGSETLGLDVLNLAALRTLLWEWVQQNIPKVGWLVPSGEGSLKRLGGVDLSFDEAIAYLKTRMALSHDIQEYYKGTGLVP